MAELGECATEMSAGDDEAPPILEREQDISTDPIKPELNDVCAFLVEHMLTRWYDVFLGLGIDRAVLNKSMEEHRFSLHSSIRDMAIIWLDRKEPPATWNALADVLRYKLMEGKIADKLEETFCGITHEEEPEPTQEAKKRDMDIYIMDYTSLLIRVADYIGRDAFGEVLFFLCELRCPDGSTLIDPSIFKDCVSSDGLLLTLLHTNQCSWRDVDLIVHILKSINRRDLLLAIREFAKRVGIGKQSVAKVHDWKRFMLVKIYLNPAIRRVDSGVVSVVKQSVCGWFSLSEMPHVFPFIGWTVDPVVLHFQPPLAVLHYIEEGFGSHKQDFVSVGIEKVVFVVNETPLPPLCATVDTNT